MERHNPLELKNLHEFQSKGSHAIAEPNGTIIKITKDGERIIASLVGTIPQGTYYKIKMLNGIEVSISSKNFAVVTKNNSKLFLQIKNESLGVVK